MDTLDRAKFFARKLVPVPGRLDSTGRDQEDYTQLLIMHVLRSPPKPGVVNKEGWVATVFFNQYNSYLRERYAIQNRTPVEVELSVSPNEEPRQLLRDVRRVISEDDFNLLVGFVACGSIAALYRELSPPLTQRGFTKKINTICAKARKVCE